jgi:fermentation-respiration switch protein FrsA (DUF1100 family)
VSWLLPAVLIWLIWAAFLFSAQRRMIFPGRYAGELRDDAFPGVERGFIEVPGAKVDAWWLPAVPGAPRPAPAVIFLHGNAEVIDEWAVSFDPLRRAGIGVLLLEYPGYGRSTGVATQVSVTDAAVAAWDLVAAKTGEVDRDRIIALGRSVGGGGACALSQQRPLAALVLSSTFTGVRKYARRYGLPGILVRHPFDNEAAVRAFDGPVLVQHGMRDGTIPFANGVRLAAAARDAELLRYQCGHNDCPWERMLEDMIEFLGRKGVLTTTDGAVGNPPGPRGVG